MKINIKSVIFLSGLTVSLSSFGDIRFPYTEGAPIDLGLSIDLKDPTSTKLQCFSAIPDPVSIELIQVGDNGLPLGVKGMRVTSDYIRSYDQLDERFQINGYYKSHAKLKDLYGANHSLELKNSSDYSGFNDEVMIAYTAIYDFGVRRLSSQPILKPEFQNLLDEGNNEEFVKNCGTHYVARESRHAKVVLIAKSLNVSDSIKKMLYGSYDSAGNGVIYGVEVGGSVGINFKREVDTLKKYTTVNIDFSAVGGMPQNADEIAKAIQQNDLGLAVGALTAYMDGVTFSTSVPSEYWLVSFENYGLDVDLNERVPSILQDLYFSSNYLDNALSRLISENKDLRNSGVNSDVLLTLQNSTIAKLQVEKSRVDSIIRKCAYENICSSSDDLNIPLEYWNSVLLQNASLESVCSFNGDFLSEINIKLNGKLLDLNIVDDFEIYRLSNDSLVRLEIDVPNMNEDGRFTARIDRNETRSFNSSSASNELIDRSRDAQYLLKLIPSFGPDQWHNLGRPVIQRITCPAVKRPG